MIIFLKHNIYRLGYLKDYSFYSLFELTQESLSYKFCFERFCSEIVGKYREIVGKYRGD